MTSYLKMLTAISLSIFMWGCNGGSDSASNAVTDSVLNPVDNSPMLLGYDGVYKNEYDESGQHVFHVTSDKKRAHQMPLPTAKAVLHKIKRDWPLAQISYQAK
ncbi:hypothetical protein ACPFUI_003580 [Vibrio cholerae]